MELIELKNSATGRELFKIADDFTKECARILAPCLEGDEVRPRERKKAHHVNRVWMIRKGDVKVPFKTTLHYAPECGYWGCVKDNHKNMLLVTDAYCLASTVRQIMTEFLFSVNRGEIND